MTSYKMVICICLVLLLQGCASNPHLLFFTNSSIGVDISVEQSQTPVKFIVGYKRQEGVLDPLGQGYAFEKGVFKNQSTSVINGIIQTKDGYFYPKGVKDDAHSVIAKMNFGATGGGSAETSAAQWFATGKAAEKLAENPSTPAAISGNSQISPQREINLSKSNTRQVFSVIKSTYNAFEEYLNDAGKNDKEAFAIKANLDKIDNETFRVPFNYYIIKNGPIVTDAKICPDINVAHWKNKSFLNVMIYLKNLNYSIENAKKIIEIHNYVEVKKESNSSVFDVNDEKVLNANIVTYEANYNDLIEKIAVNHDVVKFIEYFSNKALFRNAKLN